MRPGGNSLDLNNLPEEHGKQPLEESSMTTAASADTSRLKKKKSSGKDVDSPKVYECRFCSLKFCKSQALGGHMNRHRQERETETLNRARQLVFSNEGLASGAALGLRDLHPGSSQIPTGGFQHAGGSIGDPCLSFRPVYPRLPTQPSNPSQMQQYIYPSSSSGHSLPYSPPSYQPSHPPANNYYHCPPHRPNYGPDPSFTCLGAPLSHSYAMDGKDGAARDQTEEKNSWSCSYGHVQHMDSPPSLDRLRDNFHS